MISYIIVNYNTSDVTINMIDSIIKNCSDYEIILVDNNSTDNSVLKIKERFKENKVQVIENKANLGFSKANNIGFNNSKGDYIVFVNPDTLFSCDIGDKLYSEYKKNYLNKKVILSPQIMNSDGTEQHCRNLFPIINWALVFRKIKKIINEKFYSRINSEWLTGVCYGMERSLVEQLAGWNENYDLYSEDLDMCYRLKKLLHGKCFVIKDIKLLHYGNQSGKQIYKTQYESFRKKTNALKIFYDLYYSQDSFILYLKKMYFITRNPLIKKYLKEDANVKENNR